MKNQYFGDIKDGFKWDLLFYIYQNMGFSNLSYIPMLTDKDSSGQGNQTGRHRYKCDPILTDFFKSCIAENRRNIKELFNLTKAVTGLYSKINLEIQNDDILFTANNREKYFSQIDYSKENTLFFLDPDTGIMDKNEAKFVKYSEIEQAINSLSKDSVISVFRHFSLNPKQNIGLMKNTITKISTSSKTDNILAVPGDDLFMVFICPSNIKFFILFKVLCEYAEKHSYEAVLSGKRFNKDELYRITVDVQCTGCGFKAEGKDMPACSKCGKPLYRNSKYNLGDLYMETNGRNVTIAEAIGGGSINVFHADIPAVITFLQSQFDEIEH